MSEASKSAGQIVTVRLSEDTFANFRAQWQSLLEASAADPLFLSWEWQWNWWSQWGRSLSGELLLIAVFDGDRLIGLAPFYRHQVSHVITAKLPWLRMKLQRVEFLGGAYYSGETVLSEHLGVICCPGREAVVAGAVAAALHEQNWDQLILMHVDFNSTVMRLLDECVKNYDIYGIEIEHNEGVSIDATTSFSSWLAGLNENMRRQLYRRREYIQQLGQFRVEWATANEMDCCLDYLNQFHSQRWGRPCYGDASMAFHKALSSALRVKPGAGANWLLLRLDGDVVAVLQDYQVGSKIYNIQSGYRENIDHKISLGTLSLGFAIENAFDDAGCNSYDMLIGQGKHANYKQRYNGVSYTLSTVTYLRPSWLKYYYKVQKIWRRWRSDRQY